MQTCFSATGGYHDCPSYWSVGRSGQGIEHICHEGARMVWVAFPRNDQDCCRQHQVCQGGRFLLYTSCLHVHESVMLVTPLCYSSVSTSWWHASGAACCINKACSAQRHAWCWLLQQYAFLSEVGSILACNMSCVACIRPEDGCDVADQVDGHKRQCSQS